MSNPLSASIFVRVFIGITLTAGLVLGITQIISYFQLKQSFDLYATKQVIVLKQIGQDVLIKENYTLPADFQAFIDDYRHTMAQHVSFAFIIGLLLSLIAGLILSRQITQPISRLKNTIRAVTRSHYQIRAPETGSREIRELIHSFNRLIDELEGQEKMRQELLADISHELKTPITKIRGQVEGILDGIYAPDRSMQKKVLANINQLEYLIQALYEVNRLNPQDITLNLVKCPVKNMVTEVISGFTQKPIEFKVTINPKLTILADSNRLRQIIDNLVTNAYKFTSKGEIRITADKKQFIISDTGVGIGPADISHIFERMYRAEKSRNRHTGGLGLGLYIVKRLVSLHGWTIGVESRPNHGTTFTIAWIKTSI